MQVGQLADPCLNRFTRHFAGRQAEARVGDATASLARPSCGRLAGALPVVVAHARPLAAVGGET